jgi:hypothetical protein
MGLFRNREPLQRERPDIPRFGGGLRLHSDCDVRSCARSLSETLKVHAPTPYLHMPTLNIANVVWHGEGFAPTGAWTCSYGTDDIFVFVMWSLPRGTEVGLFPLGGSEESLATPLVGQWRQIDSSLSAMGRYEPRQLTLLAPRVPKQYYERILQAADRQVTAQNVALLAQQVAVMFAIKGQQFIATKDPAAASRFIDRHAWEGDISLPEQMLRDIGELNRGLLPYIQDLPGRVRGILLERDPGGRLPGVVWEQMS